MTPAPLPREEIERIDAVYARWKAASDSGVIPLEEMRARRCLNVALRNAWPSIKAEIEAGRGVIQKKDLMLKDMVKCIAYLRDKLRELPRSVWRDHVMSISIEEAAEIIDARITDLENKIEAGRAGGERVKALELSLRSAQGVDRLHREQIARLQEERDSWRRVAERLEGEKQSAAQPAGRVEWPIEARRLLDAAQQMTIAIGMGWDLDGVIEGLREQVDAAEKLGVKPSQDHYPPSAGADLKESGR